MSVEDEREGPPPTEAEIAARKADQAACRADKISLPTLRDTVATMPPLAELSAGLEDMIRS